LKESQSIKKGVTMVKKPKEQITVQIDSDALKIVDRIRNKVGLSRSELCSNLVIMGLDDAKLLDGIGLVSSAVYIRSLLEGYKKSITKRETE
jgi:metal-responsive CopG/Arc/MetJ family transcriptional regulator